jgi:hypothetical protein
MFGKMTLLPLENPGYDKNSAGVPTMFHPAVQKGQDGLIGMSLQDWASKLHIVGRQHLGIPTLHQGRGGDNKRF